MYNTTSLIDSEATLALIIACDPLTLVGDALCFEPLINIGRRGCGKIVAASLTRVEDGHGLRWIITQDFSGNLNPYKASNTPVLELMRAGKRLQAHKKGWSQERG